MCETTSKFQQYICEHKQQFLDELLSLVGRPTVSADPKFKDDMVNCAEYLANFGTKRLNFNARVQKTSGHPCVIMHSPKIENAPKILIYGHYDVQPAEDTELWDNPPFEPIITKEVMKGRGTSDDKGQVWAWLCALETYQKVKGSLPLNVTVLIEGEEEIGGPGLPQILKDYKDELSGQVVIVSDTSMAVKYHPTIHYALRGLVGFEVHLRTAKIDLHSGIHGGVSPNAVRELTKLVAKLHDEHSKVTVPGFYNKVLEAKDWEKQALAEIPFNEEEYAKEFDTVMQGEEGYSTNERRWFRPTLDCNGIYGGYTGPGSKTIIPATASAKFSARLVADQDPVQVLACLEKWFKDNCPKNIQLEFVPNKSLSDPYLLKREGIGEKLFNAAQRAIEIGFNKPALLCRNGGAIGVVAEFTKILKMPTLLLGLGSPDDYTHAPNEKFELKNFFSGIRMGTELLDIMAEELSSFSSER